MQRIQCLSEHLPLGREGRFCLIIVYQTHYFFKTQTERFGCISSLLGVFIFYTTNYSIATCIMSNILPTGQYERAASLDLVITRSFFERLISEFVHLTRLVSVGK